MSLWARVLLAAAMVFAMDALLFRTRIYSRVLEPDSSTGLFEQVLRREQRAQRNYGDNVILTIGDSRFAYLPRQADELTPKTGYVFRSAGVAGTDLRSWYYMLRDLDPAANRYRAIVIGVDDFYDEDGFADPTDDIRALHYVIARLRLKDVPDLAFSFHSRELQWQAMRGGLLKGLVYQPDILAFLSNPAKRVAYVRLTHSGFEQWTWDYVDSPRTMVGLQIDWPSWRVTYPPGTDAAIRYTVESLLLRKVAPQTGRYATFRREWFGRIADRYRGSRTGIVFLRLPRGPIPRPDYLAQRQRSSIHELAARPEVLLCAEHAFDALEHPEFFKDGWHLNREGQKLFAGLLTEELLKLLGPSNVQKAAK